MGHEKYDPATGQMTTGHEWNGIEELDTPVPAVVLFFLAATTLFAVIYWLLMPSWPLGYTYTKGLLGIDQREVLAKQIRDANAARSVWTERIATLDFAQIAADPVLMRRVRETGQTLFKDNCAVCHGANGGGGPGFPNLAARSWLWGGDPQSLSETIRVGINSSHPQTRVSQMMPFGVGGVLDSGKIHSVAAYVRSLSGQGLSGEDRARVEAGREVFTVNCSTCHGENAKGMREFGAPDLTDHNWMYGGDAQSVFTSIFVGRQGHMPHWEGRLSSVDIKILALYVGSLGGDGL